MNNSQQFYEQRIFDIYKVTPFRKTDFCLGYDGGSVFMDFNMTAENLIALINISFDGHGCWTLPPDSKHLDQYASEKFLALMEAEELDEKEIIKLVKQLIHLNLDYISIKPLKE